MLKKRKKEEKGERKYMANVVDIYEVLKKAHDQELIKQISCVNICFSPIVNNANQLLSVIGDKNDGVGIENIVCETSFGKRKAQTYLRVLVKLGYLQTNRQLGGLDYTWKLAN